MSTSVIRLRSIEEQVSDYKPGYAPIYPLFLGNAQAYAALAGEVNYVRMEALGDLRSKRISPKDNVLHVINVGPTKKSFKKYFNGAKFMVSVLQGTEGVESVNGQVLDEHNKQFDEMLSFGDGTQNSDVLNNGLFYSKDVNYLFETSAEVKKGTAGDYLVDLNNKISATLAKVENVPGSKIVFLYGDAANKLNAAYGPNGMLFRELLAKTGGASVTYVKLPSNMVSGHGYIVCCMDHVKLNYTSVPAVEAQGINEEEGHVWTRYQSGSAMLDVTMKNGMIKQPLTWEA